LPTGGVDGVFAAETGDAVSRFKADRAVLPADPVVGPGTTQRLDLELAYLEGVAPDPASLDAKVLRLDPFFAGVLENQFGDPGIGQKVIDVLDLGNRICFRASFLFDNFIAQHLGRFIEPIVFNDFCSVRGPCTADDFLDETDDAANYVAFLQHRNLNVPPARIAELGQTRRPDIITHRIPKEWWEIKPVSISGAIQAWIKFNKIIPAYAERGLPYLPGKSYTPTPDIVLGRFLTPEGEKLDLVLNVSARAPGLLFYILCVKGDYVTYFNRVRLAAGIAALLVALSEIIVPAAEVGTAIAALTELLQDLGIAIATLPILIRL